MGKNRKDISVIIPVYNVEEYLPACVDSVMHQDNLCFEVILVDDGSTDQSGRIADQYAGKDNRITVIHQKNRGASAARNTGFESAQGEYIIFVDSDDWIKEDSLCKLHYEAAKLQTDAIMGNILCFRQNKIIDNFYKPIPRDILYIPLSGKEYFIRLMKAKAYTPMVFNYIYRRKFLEKIYAQFEEGIMHEDELWSPVILCQAQKVAAVDVDFYYYRQRESSVMNSTNLTMRLEPMFRVADRLIGFTDCYDFSGEDAELKNWLYVNIYRIYSWAFGLLSGVKDSSYKIPEHRLDHFWKNAWEMMPDPQKKCSDYFQIAETGLKKYTDWRISDWVASIASQIGTGKKLMLIYNTERGQDLILKIEDVPADWLITTDRRYFHQADAVVFHLPELLQELEYDIDKPKGQIWIARHLESEETFPWFEFPEIKDIFDLWLSYQQNIDKEQLVCLCQRINTLNIS